MKINRELLNKYFDHTILKSDTTLSDVYKVCDEAIEFDFASVCINSCYTSYVRDRLINTNVKVCAVVGFPLGAMSSESKIKECNECIIQGATEIDVVFNIGFFKSNLIREAQDDLEGVIKLCHNNNIICKVILEVCLLTNEEIEKACIIALNAGADFLKSSTGFSTGGASQSNVSILSKYAHSKNKFVKASGGIRSGLTALELINCGADRLGTSGTIKVYKELKEIIDNPSATNITTNSNPSSVIQSSHSLYDDDIISYNSNHHNIITSTLFFIIGSQFVKYFLSKYKV